MATACWGTLGGSAVGAFANKNAGTAKAVTVTGNTISGTDAANYALSQQTGLSADINAAPVMNDISATVVSNAVALSTPALAAVVKLDMTKAVFQPVETTIAYAGLPLRTIDSSSVKNVIAPSNSTTSSTLSVILSPQTIPFNTWPLLSNVFVQVLRTPSVSQDGIVEVFVPKEAFTSNAVFAFALPPSSAANTTVASPAPLVFASSADGKDLPDWLKFDPILHTFSASSAPAYAFPLQVLLSLNGLKTAILISALP
jgi:hypothetical protein